MGARRAQTARAPAPARRVTISDVAASLGLTKGTVSRALNGYTDIAEATRARVAARAGRMGYSPLAHAQAIRTGRVRAIGLVLQLEEHDAQRPFLADFLQGITAAAGAEGWTLTVATAGSEADGRETYTRLIEDRKADGFILPRTRLDDPRVDLLLGAGTPFVMYGRTRDSRNRAWFDILGEAAMGEAVKRLAGFGHRRIAFINGLADYTYATLREEGFREGMADAELDVDEEMIIHGVATLAAGELAADALLSLDDPPTAVVCATDKAGLGVCRAAAARGLRLGRDLSVIAYDGVPESALAQPPLTTFEVDQVHAGARLASLLIRRCRGAAPDELRETALARLREGGTDGPPAFARGAPEGASE